MEKFAYKIENIVQEKLLLYETLKKVLVQEKKCIIDMDVDFLWEIAERKNQLVAEVQNARERMLSLLREHHVRLETDSKSFNLYQIIKSLPFSKKFKSDLKKYKIKLDLIKQELSTTASENRRYVNEHLSVINGIFATIVNSEGTDQYTPSGLILNNSSVKRLIAEEV